MVILDRSNVSNLLGSPASGESVIILVDDWVGKFPIYWVPQRVGRRGHIEQKIGKYCFQFIGFPSEWGVMSKFMKTTVVEGVSNLLGSPASGEVMLEVGQFVEVTLFPIYWVPQRVGRKRKLTVSI